MQKGLKNFTTENGTNKKQGFNILLPLFLLPTKYFQYFLIEF